MTIEATVFKGSANSGIVEAKSILQNPTGTKVLVRVTHSGICGTDEHHKHLDMVLGHEGVGVVQEIGDGVRAFAVGDVVGWGYIHKTCGRCVHCLKGEDNYCRTDIEMYGYHNLNQGSFGSHAVWDESYLFKIPAGLAPEYAAPLMCGGATVFQVIEEFKIRSIDRVGVIALGGLGHMAVQFLVKMGAEVVAFSSTHAKREEALSLGAKEFFATKGVDKFDTKPLDHLLVTTNAIPDWAPYLSIMKCKGVIYPLCVDSSNLVFPMMAVLMSGLTIQGSTVANRSIQHRMLEFAARHEIKPLIERFPLTKNGVEDGMQKLREGKVRYRAVLVA
ncbi:NAD(P)-dependent alcohol dehydrogenase protein [Mycena indigotica]|uniref:NAD(P)-dependent alcohol dehydrogenase protein n=1 Tax=Mycena indigotica TaxID=2126181 RepID=A0A8H6WGF0_9AGAR|nr:NAD(P)-dependent alcohol dehydrogenase protein [Mycena indigotica]KAF7315781.1 NAD(P)-dependent alcohol dehydrogenase protein [Mycena indigotica]